MRHRWAEGLRRYTIALAGAMALGLGAAGASSASGGGTTLTDCSFGALNAAVQAGGTITLDCNQPTPWVPTTIAFTAPIVVATGNSVSIGLATGQSVTFDGGGSHQLFKVEGGTLSLSHLKLARWPARTTT